MGDFRHIRDWVFDLDNTLYPAQCNLFKQIDARMTEFVGTLLDLPLPEARKVQKDYYQQYGTTLSGLMNEHSVEPHDFMDYVHDIDLSMLPVNKQLAEQLEQLPGRRFVYTNGSTGHAKNITQKLGVDHLFEGFFDIKAADYVPKPHQQPYERFLSTYDIDPAQAAMFEDMAVNLEVPYSLGMTTVLVCTASDWIADEPKGKRPARLDDVAPHVHHRTDDLTGFLSGLMTSA